MDERLEHFYRIFGTDGTGISHVLAKALSNGGDYADIFFEYTTSNMLLLQEGQVKATSVECIFGAGVRVVCGTHTGYAYTESTALADLLNAAITASAIALSYERRVAPVPLSLMHCRQDRYPVVTPWEDISVLKKKEVLDSLNDAVYRRSDAIVSVSGRITDSNSRILFANSLGNLYTDERPLAELTLGVVMKRGSRMESAYSSRSFRMGYEFLSAGRNGEGDMGESIVEEIAQEAVNSCKRLFDASQPPCGEMAVVMGSGSSGVLLHEAIGHTFEADFIRKGTSIFSDKLGKRICREGINIVDDGTIKYNRGSINFDDEGVEGQKTYLVKDGILNSYLHDRISAEYFGTAPTGNGRRESFRDMPIPRMRATYMESGNVSQQDIISSVSNGIYVDELSNGQVQIGAGDFTFFVKSGFLIENGKLTRPIKDTNIIGNGPAALADILAVGNNAVIDNGTWLCRKGQSCPVSCGMPSVLVKSLNVGGIYE